MSVDYQPTASVDEVAHAAVLLAERIRETEPTRLYCETVELCAGQPAKAAQMLMAFAAWFDLDISTRDLQLRAAMTAAQARSLR